VAGGGIDFHDADDLFYPNSQLNFDAPQYACRKIERLTQRTG